MKDLTPEHAELEQQIIETVEAGNVLEETQQHEQALIYYDQAWACCRSQRWNGRSQAGLRPATRTHIWI